MKTFSIAAAAVLAVTIGGIAMLRTPAQRAPEAAAPSDAVPAPAAADAPAPEAPTPTATTRGLAPANKTFTRTVTGLSIERYARGVIGLGGDGEFGGNGPLVTLSVTLSHTDTQILATVVGEAREVGGDGSRALFTPGTNPIPIYTVEQGNRILGIVAPTQLTTQMTYVDTDHDYDYLCAGGELPVQDGRLSPAPANFGCTRGPVGFARVLADTDGQDFEFTNAPDKVNDSNVVLLFNPITIRTATDGKGIAVPTSSRCPCRRCSRACPR